MIDGYICITAHRRENLGEPLENICRVVKRIVENNKDIRVIYPVHLNPAVRDIVYYYSKASLERSFFLCYNYYITMNYMVIQKLIGLR